MARDTGPCFLPCTGCGKVAAVAYPPKLTGLARAAMEMQMGELLEDAGEPLTVGKEAGSLFGIPAAQASALLNLRCGACYVARVQAVTT